ncbi:MAG TPA: type IV pilus twitching motility protein PilT [Erysipelotrichaceae bacterium]|nr:type IV pilus twitching motility protein PilT [Erysipelotrichaceae bacterium]
MLLEILKYARKNECSDIHLVANRKPIVRHVGELVNLDLPVLENGQVYDIIHAIISPEQYELYEQGKDVDSAYTDDAGHRYRLNIYRQQGVPAIAMRLLNNHIPTIDELKLPQILKDIAMQPRGLILVTGPTGSGKSTTLAAMIDYINDSKSHHILTLEDPIEYIHNSKKSMINQREIHKDAHDFQSALRSALREDPDVILVGEMRDYETISLALTAAETGHLVLSTLHTTGAASTIDRIIDAFPPHQQSQVRTQLAGVLKAVISQALLPKADYSGRTAVHEIMLMTDAIGNLIRENKIVQINTAIQTGLRVGMQTLDGNLAKLVSDHIISFEVANEITSNPELLKRYLGRP